MRHFSTLLLPALLLVSTSAVADRGFYIGTGIGGSHVESTVAELGLQPPAGESIQSSDFSETGFAWKVFGGYRFLDFIAAEVAWIDLGEPDTSLCFTTSPPAGVECESREWDVKTKLDGVNLDLVGSWPIGEKWEVFAKLGLFLWDAEGSGTQRAAGAAPPPLPPGLPPGGCPPFRPQIPGCEVKVKDDGEDLSAGFGAAVEVSEHFSLRGEFQWFNVGAFDTVWAITASAILAF